MAASIPNQIVARVVDHLTAAAPSGTIVKKGRRHPVKVKGTLVQVYWMKETVRTIGDPRRPTIHSRNGSLAVKVTVLGDDDAFDAERIWIVAAMNSIGNTPRLWKDISETETVFDVEESSEDGDVLANAILFAVEFTTLPGDITAGN